MNDILHLNSSIIKSQKVHYCEKNNTAIAKTPTQIPVLQQETLEIENFIIQIKRQKGVVSNLEIVCSCGKSVALDFSYLEEESNA